MIYLNMQIKFKEILSVPCGIRYIYDNLELSSPLSASLLQDTCMEISSEAIDSYYAELISFSKFFFEKGSLSDKLERIKLILSHLKDIRGTVKRVSENYVLGDIELFEIKNLSIINQQLNDILMTHDELPFYLPNLEKVLNLLDPEGNRVGSFYVYDIYDPELKAIREKLKSEPKYKDEFFYKCSILEEKVREKLSAEINTHYEELKNSLYTLSRFDIFIAKIEQKEKLGLSWPKVSGESTVYKQLFNPEILNILLQQKSEYQKTDITFCRDFPVLITGANMGGKSLTLKTLALSQYLFQFGFGVPATDASIVPVESIHYSFGDEEDYKRGLSSFAGEMKRIDNLLKTIKSGIYVLALVDEPARTTNPDEGKAIASALLEMLNKYASMSVLTTHYSFECSNCRRLRVKGFVNGEMNYSLIPSDNSDAPAEALNIAENIGIDREWIDLSRKKLERQKTDKNAK